MNLDLNGHTADVEQALAGGATQPAGWFRFYFNDQRWEWSEQVQRMHGYEPGTVTPSTELVLAHKPPEDRGQVAATIDDILNPRNVWADKRAYDRQAADLASRFEDNFQQFDASEQVRAAGPKAR